MAEKPGSHVQPVQNASSSSTAQEVGEKQETPGIPRDVQLMQNILASAGIHDYDPRLLSQMIEFSYAYTQDLLSEAKAICDYASKKSVDESDVHFALNGSADKRFKGEGKAKKLMVELATQKNNIPMPTIKQSSGLRLPNDRFCLMNPSYVWHNTMQDTDSTDQNRDGMQAYSTSVSQDKVMRMLNTPNPMKRKANTAIEDEYD
ncbi:hypothetical protein QR680_003438 [Steinernema hermaphroditum]|uniref:Transcription initiation factor TFIID subunit 9 n=1 Tax=Steinernema hermaphroditum TaxID=289476 RepID=A0AA39H6S0_9BILA|nr:hypothetical protein QR680_003438 [Steinernema hermaphroditum]